MKKVFIALLMIGFAATLSFAQDTFVEKEAKAVGDLTKDTVELIGKVLSVVTPDPDKGIPTGTVKIVDDVGRVSTLGVTQATEIVDTTLNTISLGQLQKDAKVKIWKKAGAEEVEKISVVK